MSSPSTIYVPTTPKAPKRRRVSQLKLPYVPFECDTFESESEPEIQAKPRTEEKTEDRLWDDWPIHQGYLTYTLEDVALENSKDMLERWLKLYSPSRQPWSEEEFFYVRLMAMAIQHKLDKISNVN